MPDTPFALWQSRTGLTRAADAAAALGITRQAVDLLRKGQREPSGPLRRLMEVLAEHPEVIRKPAAKSRSAARSPSPS